MVLRLITDVHLPLTINRFSLVRTLPFPTCRLCRSRLSSGWTAAENQQRRRTMKAVVYNGPRDVSVKNVPDARIEQPNDVVIKITTTNICGSDLHMYEGRTDFKPGGVFGHENTGEVVEVGPGISRIKKGDQVSLPFNIGCGFCKNCEAGLTAYCLTVYPGMAGAAYGFADMGPFPGGQAEYLRVTYGDFNCLRLPEDAREKQDDYAFLSDIFPTGWHSTRLAGLQPRRDHCDLWGRPGWFDGRLVCNHPGRQQSHGGRSPPRQACSGGADRLHPHRRLESFPR